MRIAVLSWSNRLVGGAEQYLRKFLSAAVTMGHDVAFSYDVELPSSRPLIALPPVPRWSAAELGPGRAIEELRAWGPDVIYTHGLRNPGLEEQAYAVAPAVFFAHA